jgi:hypothetical protein
MPGMTHQRGSSAIAVILILFLLLALGAGAYFFYKQKQKENFPQSTTFDYVDLNEDVVVFLFQSVSLLYNRTVQLNSELTLIAAELKRIDELENQYPSEKRTIEEERKLWLQLQKKLELSVQSLKAAAESYYVAYSVNPSKGRDLIRENVRDLVSDIDDVLKESNTETRRLKSTSSRSPLDRLKDLF